VLEKARRRQSAILLALDQFEEYFLYHNAEMAAFEALLAKLANRRESLVHVLLSLRRDRLFLLDRLRRHAIHPAEPVPDRSGRRGWGRDAARTPIIGYNSPHTAGITVSDDVVDAVVCGADEHEIFQRLLPPKPSSRQPPARLQKSFGNCYGGSHWWRLPPLRLVSGR
jgi:hypothetical protein